MTWQAASRSRKRAAALFQAVARDMNLAAEEAELRVFATAFEAPAA